MKTIAIILLTALLAIPAWSQELFSTLTEKFSDREGFSATNLTRDMFDLYLKKKQVEADSPVYETIKKLNNILVVSLSNVPSGKEGEKTADVLPEMHKGILDYYKNLSFTLFKTENRNGEDLKVFLKKNGEKVSAMSVVSATATKVSVIELSGDIDLANISELNKALNIRGLENLYKVNGQPGNVEFGQNFDFGNFHYKFSPDQQFQIQMQADQIRKLAEEHARQFDLKNFEFTEKQKEFAEKQKEMAEKYREMAEKHRRQPIFLTTPGDTNVVFYLNGKKVDKKEISGINPENIESVEVNRPDPGKSNQKSTIRIKTKK